MRAGRHCRAAARAGCLAVLLLLSRAPCHGFGEVGHLGVYGAALHALHAVDPTLCATAWESRWAKACVFPDAAVTYPHIPEAYEIQLGVWIQVLNQRVTLPLPSLSSSLPLVGDWPAVFPYALNSSDHYFDPTDPTRTAPNYATQEQLTTTLHGVAGLAAEAAMQTIPVLNALPPGTVRDAVKATIATAVFDHLHGYTQQLLAKRRTFDEYDRDAEGSVDLDGTDGAGYNALSAILFYLNGRSRTADPNSNPSGLAPTEGCVPLWRRGDRANGAIALGAALHYVGDLFSPGHTDWTNWHLMLVLQPELGTDALFRHKRFDDEGDQYFLNREVSRLAVPRLILRFGTTGPGACGLPGAPGAAGLGEALTGNPQDLPGALLEAAGNSRNLWLSGSPQSAGYHAHLEDCVALCAGVVDWAFSRAAEPDGLYRRDASNFEGMAAALLAQGVPDAVIDPTRLDGKKLSGALGGIDQDDYFPIAGNTSRFLQVSFSFGGGAATAGHVVALAATSPPTILAEAHVSSSGVASLDLKGTPSEFLLRVSSPQGTACNYTVSFGGGDQLRLIVQAVPPVVNRGASLQFEGSVLDGSGHPQIGQQVAVEDTIAQQSRGADPSLRTDAEGKFHYAVPTGFAEPGLYAFAFFLGPESGEQIVTVCVADPACQSKRLPKVQVPLGSWGSLAESYDTEPALFSTTTRFVTTTPTTTGRIPPSSYEAMAQQGQLIGRACSGFFCQAAGEFVGNPVTDLAVVVAFVSCTVPELSSKAVCAGSLGYLAKAATKATVIGAIKNHIEQDPELTALQKRQAFALVNGVNAIVSAAMLDPSTGLVGWSEAATAWNAAKTYVEFVQLPVSVATSVAAASDSPALNTALSLTVSFPDAGRVVNYCVVPISRNSPDSGQLDLVFCIDQSGSMMDDIRAVQEASDATLSALAGYAGDNDISLQVGLVVFTRHDEPGWIVGTPLSSDVASVRQAILGISITDEAVGKGGNEDLYGALMYAMNEPVGGQRVAMGWRPGAAKILIPLGDEPPDDPDWENRTLADVSRVAEALDPVHMYPLLTPKQGSKYLDEAAAAMNRLAKATGGQTIRVRDAREVPAKIVSTVKLAVRRHKEEVWRKGHPPIALYTTQIVVGAVLLGLIALAGVTYGLRRTRLRTAMQTARARLDPRLTGARGLPPPSPPFP